MADQALPPNQPPPASDGNINPAQPSADDRSDTARLEKRKKLVLRQGGGAGETGEVPAPGDAPSSQLVDPTRRRDTNTASLKRLRPQDGTAAPQVDQDTTETVNIKVIKEQKKQFRNMMTSSQTLRVKPEDAAEAPELAATPSQQTNAPAAAAEGGDKQRTLKIKTPAQTDARTESIQRSQVAPSAMPTTEVPAAPPPAPASLASTASPKSTLKIKAPPGVAPVQAAGPKPGATLKIKAPAPSAAQTQVTETPAPAETVRQPAPTAAKAGKTLKLRSGTPAAMPSGGAAPQAAAAAPQPVPYDTMAVPGWGYFLPAVASMALVIAVIVYSIKSAQVLFNGQLL